MRPEKRTGYTKRARHCNASGKKGQRRRYASNADFPSRIRCTSAEVL